MPRVDAAPVEQGPGWGCSCPAWRPGEPTPEQALKALARSANVTVEGPEGAGGGRLEFRCWTDPDSRYVVTFDPARAGGWGKHALACLSHWLPWHRQAALGAAEALEELDRLRKENKKLRREVTKWQRKATGS